MTELLAIFLVCITAAGLPCDPLWQQRAAMQPAPEQEVTDFSMPKNPKGKLAGLERQCFHIPHLVNLPW